MWTDIHNIKSINKLTGLGVGSIVQDLQHSLKHLGGYQVEGI